MHGQKLCFKLHLGLTFKHVKGYGKSNRQLPVSYLLADVRDLGGGELLAAFAGAKAL